MKSKTFSVIIVAALLSACAARHPNPRLVYGLGDDELNLLGHQLGYRVDALGMSDYRFTRGRHTFHVSARLNLSGTRRTQADGPVVITYKPPGRRRPLQSHLSVDRGVPFATVEDHFRRFLDEVGLPASPKRL